MSFSSPGFKISLTEGVVLGCIFVSRLTAAPLEGARVEVPYPEFRAILEDSTGRKSADAIASAVLSARYEVEFAGDFLSGSATFDVQTFQEGTHLVALLSDKAIVESFQPEDAVLVHSGKFLALVVEGRRKSRVTLRFHARIESGGEHRFVALGSAPAALASVKAVNIPKGAGFRLSGGYQHGDTWYLNGSDTIRMELSPIDVPKPPALALPAIVSEVTSTMRVVRDGALYNTMKWRVRHRDSVDFLLEMPPDVQFVAFSIGGRPAQPSRIEGRSLEIHLPEIKSDAAETVVEFSYTTHKPPFAPVRGEISLELPSTPLLVEKSDWQLRLPAGFEPVAMDGNVECEPSKEEGIVHLRREISTGEAPALRLFYEKAEPAKKP